MLLAAAGILALVLTACTGRGGGQLPASAGFTGPASFGFSFSCEDKGGINPQPGKLSIELSYTDHGSSLIGSSFSIHGTVDQIDPVVESQLCIGQNPPPNPPGNNVLTFLGRYRLTSSPRPAGFPSTCPTQETSTSPLCRFEVTVRDNDRNLAPSQGDFFSIDLTTVTTLCNSAPPVPPDPTCSDLPTGFYTRAGYLSSGNLTVN